VVGTGWSALGAASPALMFMFHRYLVEEGARPDDALRLAQLWMLDPYRDYPDGFPRHLVGAGDDLADPRRWAAVRHHGR
jgi:CHAT domain-containing protein